MTDREAMFALAAPEPDYFDHPQGWQVWQKKRITALVHVKLAKIIEAKNPTLTP